jgi:hypothetical protein
MPVFSLIQLNSDSMGCRTRLTASENGLCYMLEVYAPIKKKQQERFSGLERVFTLIPPDPTPLLL